MMKQNPDRRSFLKGLAGSLGSFLAVGGNWLFPESKHLVAQKNSQSISNESTLPSQSAIGERYGGFVLLPEGVPLPHFVENYKFGIPTMCNVGTAEDPVSGATHETFLNPRLLARRGRFPVYVLRRRAPILRQFRLRFYNASLIGYMAGNVFGGRVNYSAFDPEGNIDFTAVSVAAQTDFPRPFPLWASDPVEEGGQALVLEKIDYVPGGKGIKIDSMVGFSLHWIQYNVYYRLTSRYLPGMEPQQLASALHLV